ncbi:unnamed protein product, partial [Allacma fusca]
DPKFIPQLSLLQIDVKSVGE